MSTLTSNLFCMGNRLNPMASIVEDDREDHFSLLEDSDVEKGAILVDSDNETDASLDI